MNDLESFVNAEGFAVEVFDGFLYGGELRMRSISLDANRKKAFLSIAAKAQ